MTDSKKVSVPFARIARECLIYGTLINCLFVPAMLALLYPVLVFAGLGGAAALINLILLGGIASILAVYFIVARFLSRKVVAEVRVLSERNQSETLPESERLVLQLYELGYGVRNQAESWVIYPPMGGRLILRRLEDLTRYVESAQQSRG